MPIRISQDDDLELGDDVVTQAIAILARRGAGKTYTAGVLVEQVVKARLPVVILDPTGAWWGLRTSANGSKPGLQVVILGGEHGDVPLDRGAGKEIADVVVEHPGAYVIDLSGFESKAAEQAFAADFLERLYRAKATDKTALLVVVDEADLFAPQQPRDKGDQLRTLGALEAIVRRGRIRGLGVLLISQRAAVLNKNVLTQTEVLVVMQTTGPQDRAAIDEWIKGNGSAEERELVLGSLASLERGEAWIWSPSWLRTLKRIRIRAKTTFDSSRTPEAGEPLVAPRAFAQVDLEQLGARIQAAVEKAKADDPKELRRQIRELERRESNALQRLAKTELELRDRAPETVERIVEVPVLNGQVGELVVASSKLLEVATGIADAAAVIASVGERIVEAIDRVSAAPRPAAQQGVSPLATPARRGPEQRPGAPRNAPEGGGVAPRAPLGELGGAPQLDRPLKAGARRMLSALAQLHPTPLTRGQIATLSDISPTSGTFSDYLSAIRSAGLILEVGHTIALSDDGQALLAGELGSGAPTSDELLAMWGRKLKAGARRMLDVLHEVYPDGLTRAELGERAEISSTSGTFSDYLSMLRRTGLLDESQPGIVRAGESLFLGTAR